MTRGGSEGAPAWGTPESGGQLGGAPAWGTPGGGHFRPVPPGPTERADFGCVGCLVTALATVVWFFVSLAAVEADTVVGRWLDVRWSLTTGGAVAQAEPGWPGYDTVDVARGTRLYIEGAEPRTTCKVGAADGGWTALDVRAGSGRSAEFTAAASPLRVRCDDPGASSFVYLWRDDAADIRRFHQLAPVAALLWVFGVGAVIVGALRLLIWWAVRRPR